MLVCNSRERRSSRWSAGREAEEAKCVAEMIAFEFNSTIKINEGTERNRVSDLGEGEVEDVVC
jgi:hypothetical protein